MTKHRWISRKQSGYINGLERDSGHRMAWPQRSAGGASMQWGKDAISDLLARQGDGNAADIDNELHDASCPACAMDRLDV